MQAALVRQQPTYCVFRRGTFWCGLSAETVRKVMPRPMLVSVPRCPPVLVGLCHERGEFLPVLTLDAALGNNSLASEPFLLVIDDHQGSWGLLVDEVASLSVLEPSSAPDAAPDSGWSEVVTGWAIFERQVVRIIDHVRFRELTERQLASFWPNTQVRAVGSTESIPLMTMGRKG